MNRVVAFLNLRHIETLSSAVLTLLNPVNRCTGELLSSASSIVRLQSSMASLMAVRARITIRGVALRPGFAAPNIEKAYFMLISILIHKEKKYVLEYDKLV